MAPFFELHERDFSGGFKPSRSSRWSGLICQLWFVRNEFSEKSELPALIDPSRHLKSDYEVQRAVCSEVA